MKISKSVVPAVLLAAVLSAGLHAGASAAEKTGKTLFRQHCSVCHPEGGNLINPKKTLHKKDLDANRIKKPADIISTMRNPGPGMTRFDTMTIPDKEAALIAEYVLKTFK